MSYEKKQGHLNFFMPNIPFATTTSGVLREIDVGGSTAVHGEYVCYRKCLITRLAFAVTGEAISGTSVAPVVTFTKHPTPLSSSGAAVLDTLTLPTGTAIGKVVYVDCTPTAFAVGDSLEISWTIGTGTPTGMGHVYWECEDSPEQAANVTDMIASA